MKQLVYILSFFLLNGIYQKARSQPLASDQKTVDSLINYLSTSLPDTNKVKNLITLARLFTTTKPNLSIKYAKEGLTLSEKLNYPYGSINSLLSLAFTSAITGKWQEATQSTYKGLSISELYNPVQAINFYNMFALISENQKNTRKRLDWLLKSYHHLGLSYKNAK